MPLLHGLPGALATFDSRPGVGLSPSRPLLGLQGRQALTAGRCKARHPLPALLGCAE